jgi:uncharacterized membrane protein YkvA (DUF1232 family)
MTPDKFFAGHEEPLLDSLKVRARRLKSESRALYFAARHPLTPWYAKWIAAITVAYALSPIDLIPDFVPVLGYLDDLVLVPLGIALAIRLIPAEVLAECRARADEEAPRERKPGYAAAMMIILIWLALAVLCIYWFTSHSRSSGS